MHQEITGFISTVGILHVHVKREDKKLKQLYIFE